MEWVEVPRKEKCEHLQGRSEIAPPASALRVSGASPSEPRPTSRLHIKQRYDHLYFIARCTMSRDGISTRKTTVELRAELKTWETEFAKTNARKPAREDIKKDPTIGVSVSSGELFTYADRHMSQLPNTKSMTAFEDTALNRRQRRKSLLRLRRIRLSTMP